MRKVFLTLLSVLLILSLIGCQSDGKVDDQYAYNTGILTNPAAPTAGDPDIAAIAGYTEVGIDGMEIPFAVPDTDIEILSAGYYSGVYVEDNSGDLCSDIPAVVIRNNGSQTVAYSTFTARYDDENTMTFMPTNIPAGCCAVILASDKELKWDDVRQFEIVDSVQHSSGDLTVIRGKVGVSYETDHFVVTNLTAENLGDVYIRYKYITAGNAYLGGITRSLSASSLGAHQTQELYTSFDADNSAIIAVENVK